MANPAKSNLLSIIDAISPNFREKDSSRALLESTVTDFFAKIGQCIDDPQQCIDDPQQCIDDVKEFQLDSYLSPWEDQRAYANLEGRDPGEGRIRTRAEITGIVLHSTGRQQFRNSEGWVRRVRANFIIPASGTILYCHDVTEQRNSSNDLNRSTVPVEFIGNFRMTNGNWFPRSMSIRKINAIFT